MSPEGVLAALTLHLSASQGQHSPSPRPADKRAGTRLISRARVTGPRSAFPPQRPVQTAVLALARAAAELGEEGSIDGQATARSRAERQAGLMSGALCQDGGKGGRLGVALPDMPTCAQCVDRPPWLPCACVRAGPLSNPSHSPSHRPGLTSHTRRTTSVSCLTDIAAGMSSSAGVREGQRPPVRERGGRRCNSDVRSRPTRLGSLVPVCELKVLMPSSLVALPAAQCRHNLFSSALPGSASLCPCGWSLRSSSPVSVHRSSQRGHPPLMVLCMHCAYSSPSSDERTCA